MYYDKFIALVSPVCECGNEKKFRGLGEGYRTFCSVKCMNSNSDIRKQRSFNAKYQIVRGTTIGRKQSQETIRKRIENTDQSKKEKTRKKTMLEKYGVDNPSQLEEVKAIVSQKGTGRKHPPRRPEHIKKIVESKKRNGTLSHSNSTRAKISRSLNEYYQNGDDQSITTTSIPSNGRGHKTGFHKGILYRSSYELLFIIFCEKNNIRIESCETKERRVRYEYEGKKRWYYPDFYLPDLDACVEIKPSSMMNELFYVKKKYAEQVYNNFVVLTERELSNEEYLNEYFCAR
jgi:hypothetical protein